MYIYIYITFAYGGETLPCMHELRPAIHACRAGMLPVPDTLAVIAALIPAASYLFNSK